MLRVGPEKAHDYETWTLNECRKATHSVHRVWMPESCWRGRRASTERNWWQWWSLSDALKRSTKKSTADFLAFEGLRISWGREPVTCLHSLPVIFWVLTSMAAWLLPQPLNIVLRNVTENVLHFLCAPMSTPYKLVKINEKTQLRTNS